MLSIMFCVIPVSADSGDEPVLYQFVEVKPLFNACGEGSLADFESWIIDNLSLNDKEESASVVFSFIVEKDGSVSETEIIRDNTGDPAMRSDLERVLRMIPRWTPGTTRGGIPQRVSAMMRVDFMRPDLLRSAQQAAREKSRQKTWLENKSKAEEFIASFGINCPEDALMSKEQLDSIVDSADRAVVVLYLCQPMHRIVKDCLEEWDDATGEYTRDDYILKVIYGEAFENEQDMYRFCRNLGLEHYPSVLFVRDRSGSSECRNFFPAEEFASWFSEMMRKSAF